MAELYFAMSALFFSACLQGIVGFGSGMVSMSLLSLIWPVAQATAILNPLGLVLSGSLLWQQRQALSLKIIKPSIIGLPFGVMIGLLALTNLPETYLKLLLGCTLLLAVINNVWRKQKNDIKPSPLYGFVAGVFSGICGVSVSASGPPILVYATLAGWNKTLFRANLAAFFFSASITACIGLMSKGFLTLETLKMTFFLIPVVLLGSKVGFHLGQRLPQVHFTRFTLALLTLLALRFIISGIA